MASRNALIVAVIIVALLAIIALVYVIIPMFFVASMFGPSSSGAPSQITQFNIEGCGDALSREYSEKYAAYEDQISDNSFFFRWIYLEYEEVDCSNIDDFRSLVSDYEAWIEGPYAAARDDLISVLEGVKGCNPGKYEASMGMIEMNDPGSRLEMYREPLESFTGSC